MRKRPLFYMACVFLMGLVWGRYKAWLIWGPLLWFLLGECFWGIQHKRRKQMIGRSVLLLSIFFLGAFRMENQECFRDTYLSELKDGDAVTVWGEISKIEDTAYGSRVYLSDCYVSLKRGATPCNKVLVYTSSAYLQVGQIHKISGEFHKFNQARNQGSFDVEVFYQSQKIDFYLNAEDFELLEHKENVFTEWLLSVREKLLAVYEICAVEKVAGFLSAMLLGDKELLDDSLKELLTEGGIAHILAISGLHMSILGRGGYRFMRKRGVGFVAAGIIGSILLFSYSFMVGSSMSSERAVLMLLIFFFGQVIGRSYDMLNALGVVGLYLLWDNPFLLEYSGFWFSCLALVGIGFVSDVFSWKTKLLSGVWSSLGISLATMPVTALCYFEVPFYSALVNAVVLPLLAPVFFLGALGGVIGLWWPGLASVVLFPCQLALGLFEGICAFVGNLPGSSVLTGEPTVFQVVIYYAVLLAGLTFLRFLRKKVAGNARSKGERKIWISWTVCKILLTLSCLFIIAFPKAHEFEISFLDVGQGDGIYLCMPDETHIFIDGGSSDETLIGKNGILPFLKSKQIREIDYWFVSHADTDHISGLKEVLESGYRVKNLVVAEAGPKDAILSELLRMAQENGTKVIYMSAGDYLSKTGESWSIKCLYPDNIEVIDKNEASLVLSVRIRMPGIEDITALFSGDVSTEVEEQLLENGALEEVFLYKAAHHGSKYSNGDNSLRVLSPKITVISCGKDNSYGHPHTETLERLDMIGSKVLQTQHYGQITITTKNTSIKVRTLIQ